MLRQSQHERTIGNDCSINPFALSPSKAGIAEIAADWAGLQFFRSPQPEGAVTQHDTGTQQ